MKLYYFTAICWQWISVIVIVHKIFKRIRLEKWFTSIERCDIRVGLWHISFSKVFLVAVFWSWRRCNAFYYFIKANLILVQNNPRKLCLWPLSIIFGRYLFFFLFSKACNKFEIIFCTSEFVPIHTVYLIALITNPPPSNPYIQVIQSTIKELKFF